MNPIWHETLDACGARIDHGRVTDFGDAAGELEAAAVATVVSPLTDLGLLLVRGAEAMTFLHNQLTSDVRHLTETSAQHSTWCSAKGRMLASFIVFRYDDAYCLQLSHDLLPAIARRLQMFILRSKVTIADGSSHFAMIAVSGPDAARTLAATHLPVPAEPLTTAAFPAGMVICLDPLRFEILVEMATAPQVWRQLQTLARAVGAPVWRWIEIQSGIPLITEPTREEFVPQMADFERLGAVSFHKGCYPGQEVIARTQYLGKVKRHLYRVHSATPLLAGNALYSPGSPQQPCGIIANAAPAPGGGYDALAVVQENHVGDGHLCATAAGGPAVEVSRIERSS